LIGHAALDMRGFGRPTKGSSKRTLPWLAAVGFSFWNRIASPSSFVLPTSLHVSVSTPCLESFGVLRWSMRVIDFEELRGLADQTRHFIHTSQDQALALRVVVSEHDVVLGIFPSASEGMGLHVIKGAELLRQIANTNAAYDYTHTAIAVHNREQAVALEQALAA